MENLKIYDSVRYVPEAAQKKITGGRLNGYTDINPMWRIKTLTEQFGPVGVGWFIEITKQEIIQGPDAQMAAFVNILLFVKIGGEWSKGIFGTGGSSFVAQEKSGLYMSDECFKMALTDAISVACKMLGFGADIYWAKDNSKYAITQQTAAPEKPWLNLTAKDGSLTEIGKKTIEAIVKGERTIEQLTDKFQVSKSGIALINNALNTNKP